MSIGTGRVASGVAQLAGNSHGVNPTTATLRYGSAAIASGVAQLSGSRYQSQPVVFDSAAAVAHYFMQGWLPDGSAVAWFSNGAPDLSPTATEPACDVGSILAMGIRRVF